MLRAQPQRLHSQLQLQVEVQLRPPAVQVMLQIVLMQPVKVQVPRPNLLLTQVTVQLRLLVVQLRRVIALRQQQEVQVMRTLC